MKEKRKVLVSRFMTVGVEKDNEEQMLVKKE